MDVIAKTRELGAVIQQDERYLNFTKAREQNEKDDALNALIAKLNLIQMSYQQEDMKDTPDENVKAGYDREFREVYDQVMQNPNMIAYQTAKQEVDEMMQYVMQLLSLCVNGEDPATCEVPEPHDCSCGCDGCSGCH
ncbi:MAG: YlbF family regulator [Clostridia bacterium]|nr:YlbF family regulator [Clostridia bacterium]